MKGIFTFILSVFFFGHCHAIVSDTLRIDTGALNQLTANSYHVGDTASISVRVYNDGDSVVNDNLAFGYQIGATAPRLTSASDSIVQYSNALVTIPPHGSLLLTSIQFSFNQSEYVIGSSIVVIWPVALHNNTVIVDSARKVITVTDTLTAIINSAGNENLRVFMSGQQLWVECNDKNLVKEVRIYDVTGKLIAQQEVHQQGQIPMDKYSTGVYFAEVILNNNKSKAFKVFNAPVR